MSGVPILFLVVGFPTEEDEKLLILKRLEHELKTWNEHLSGCNLSVELRSLIGDETKVAHGQRELVLKNEKLTFVLLYNPTVSSLRLFSKQYLAVKSCYRQLLYCGPALADCGSWLLRDGLLQFGDFARILKEVEMPDFEPFCVNAYAVGKWSQDNLEKSTSLCIKLNPEKQQESAAGDLDSGLSDVVSSFFEEKVSPVGKRVIYAAKERLAMDCLGLQNRNSNVLTIGDFKMVINADAAKFPTSLLNDADLLLLTTSDIRSLKWLESCVASPLEESIHIGMIYSNALSLLPQPHARAAPTDASSSCCSTGEKEKTLMVNVGETLKSLMGHLSEANIPIQNCFSSNNPKPVTVYHKAGFGTLQLYPVAPSGDGKEVKDFQKNPNNEGSLPGFPSTSCVLVWLPFNKKVQPLRMFFGGLASQLSIIEGLSKLKNLQIFSAWEEQASAVESLNKLNKLKSVKPAVQEKPVPALTNGGSQKGKTSGRVKPSETSNAAAATLLGQKAAKPVDKNQTLPLMSKIERTDKNKSFNTTILSVPSKHEPAKPLASKPLKASASSAVATAAPKAVAATAAVAPKAPASAVAPKAAAKPPAKEPTASTGSFKPSTDAPAKQTSQSKPLLSKPPVKAAPALSKAKSSKPVSVPQKKEIGDKAKLETHSPRLEKKAKPQKATEKKDAEKKEPKPVPRPVAAKTLIDQEPVKAVLEEEVIKPLVIESLGAKPESVVSESQREILDIVSPATESSGREKEDAETVDELAALDRKSEGSDLMSPSDAVESSQEKMDLPTTPKESADLPVCEDVHELEERNVQVMDGNFETEEDIVCENAETEEEIVCGEDDLNGDSVLAHDGRHDLDQDSLGNDDSEKEPIKSDIATPEEEAETNFREEVDALPGRPVLTESTKQISDEMVKSGISLTESAGTESAPNENLYSVDQDLEDESPIGDEEMESIQMERTLKEDVALGEKDTEVVDFCGDVPVALDSPDLICREVLEGEECIEKDVLEEPEKLMEAQKQSAEKPEPESATDAAQVDEIIDFKKSAAEEAISHGDIFQAAADEVEEAQTELGQEDEVGRVVVESELIEGISDFGGCQLDTLLSSQQARSDVSELSTDVATEPIVEEAVVVSQPEEEQREPFECRDEELMDISESSNGLDVVKEQLPFGSEMIESSAAEKEKVNEGGDVGTFDDDLGAKLSDRVHLEDDSTFDQTFREDCSVGRDEEEHQQRSEEVEEKVESLINFGVSTDEAPLLLQSCLKKESGISNLAALCNPFSCSEGEENDSTRALAGSVSDSIPETKRSRGSDDLGEGNDSICGKEEDRPKEETEFGQFCGEVADQLSKLKEHRDVVLEELMTSGDDNNIVIYNKNAAFPRKERPDELSCLKKESGISNLAALCNPFSCSEGEENDSTRALAGSVSDSIPETKRSRGSDDLGEGNDSICGKEEDRPKEETEFGQFCGEVADQLSKLKEHRDVVEELMTSGDDNNIVIYNKNVAFPRKERPDELSEEDQDELDTISEQPEIEEEEERLMGRVDQVLPFSLTEGLNPGQLIDVGDHQPVILPDVLDTLAASEDKSGLDVEESKCGQPQEQKDEPNNFFGDFHGTSFPEASVVIPDHGKDFNHTAEHQIQDLSPDDISASVHSSSATADLIAAWGEPMKLPSPDKPRPAGTKKDVDTSAAQAPAVAGDQAAKKKAAVKPANGSGDAAAAVKSTEARKSGRTEARKSDVVHKPSTSTPVVRPFYTDMAFIHDSEDEHANGSYGVDFFRRVRAYCYVFSSSSVGVLDQLLEAKQSWEGPTVPTLAVASNMEWSKVEAWMSAKKDLLAKLYITVLRSIDQGVFECALHLRTL